MSGNATRRYVLVAGSIVTATAKATLHDVRATCEDLAGEGVVDPADPVGTLALEVRVRVGEFKTGSFLQDVAMRRHVDVKAHPQAVFRIESATGMLDDLAIEGSVTYRGVAVAVKARGRMAFSSDAATGEATFDLDLSRFGLQPPKFLVLEVADVVRVEAKLKARAR